MSRLILPFGLAFVAVTLSASVATAKPCPNIMLVLDQSGSMSQDPDGNEAGAPGFTTSKWDLLNQVIGDVAKTYGDHVPFGLVLFSLGSQTVNDVVCYNQTKVTVPLAHSSSSDIVKALAAATPNGDTNTNGAVRRAREVFSNPASYLNEPMLADPKRGNYIIIITDGDPNCGVDLKDQRDNNNSEILTHDNASATLFGTLDEINSAFHQTPPVKTFVVGFDGSGGVNVQNLNTMGYYGKAKVTKPPCGSIGGPVCYFTAGKSYAEFKKVIDDIVNEAGGGEFGGAICDDTCNSLGCPDGFKCTSTEVNPSPHCEMDSCAGKQCDATSFCRNGLCIKSCAQGCKDTEICTNGVCQPDKCKGVMCSASQVCNPDNGKCVAFPCPDCTPGSVCDIKTGHCVANFCSGKYPISCPKGMMCVNNGNCAAPLGGVKSGCSTAGPSSGGAGGYDASMVLAGAALLLSLAMLLRRSPA